MKNIKRDIRKQTTDRKGLGLRDPRMLTGRVALYQ